jgi:transcription elongation factor GreA
MGNSIYLTRDGRNRMLDELDALKQRKPQLQEEIARAREHGDLRENAEYHAAKETMTNLGRRIAELEAKLSRTKIIEEQNIERDKIYIGVTVQLKDEDGDTYTYTIVDVEEASLAEHKISVQSPLAQGLLGHRKGDTVQVQLPAGPMTYEILDLSR